MDRAARLVAARGVRGWTMDDLAREASIAKRTLYGIVKSKEEVVTAIVLDRIGAVQSELGGTVAGDTPTTLHAFRATMENGIEVYSRLLTATFGPSIQEAFRVYPAVEDIVIERRAELTSAIVEYLAHAATLGYVAEDVVPAELIDILQATVLYLVKLGLTERELQERLGRALRRLLTGVVHGSRTDAGKDQQ